MNRINRKEEINKNFHLLKDKDIEIVWTTKNGGMFPEFVEEHLFLGRWRTIFPDAPVKRLPDVSYYDLVTKPSEELTASILRR